MITGKLVLNLRFCAVGAAMALSANVFGTGGVTRPDGTAALPDGRKLKLVWSDEFCGDRLDESKWSYRTNFWGQRAHWFATPEDNAVEVRDGLLHLKLVKRADGQFVSPQLQTGELVWDVPHRPITKDSVGFWPLPRRAKPKFMHRYGYYECRCRLQQMPGSEKMKIAGDDYELSPGEKRFGLDYRLHVYDVLLGVHRRVVEIYPFGGDALRRQRVTDLQRSPSGQPGLLPGEGRSIAQVVHETVLPERVQHAAGRGGIAVQGAERLRIYVAAAVLPPGAQGLQPSDHLSFRFLHEARNQNRRRCRHPPCR